MKKIVDKKIYSKEEIQKLKSNIKLEEVVEKDFHLDKFGKNYFTVCPFCGAKKALSMENVEIESEPILEKDEFKNFDSETYRKQVFSMFGGELEKVSIQFDKELLSDVYDKFGTELHILKMSNGGLKTTLEIQVSKTFFLWVVGTLGKVKITEPSNVVEKFNSFIKQITDNY